MRREVISSANTLAALFVPPRCMICGRQGTPGAAACDRCETQLVSAARGRPLRRAGSALDGVVAAYEYAGVARSAIHALKFEGRAALAERMGELLAERSGPALAGAEVAIVPVPAHPSNRRARGFDQSALLAAGLAAATGLPVVRCLARHGLRGAQSRLGRADRMAVPAGEFTLKKRPNRQSAGDSLAAFPTNVVVCDDVATTTCTLEACASAIRERYNVQTIHGLAFASVNAGS